MLQGGRDFLEAVNDFLFVEHAPEAADILFVPGSNTPENALHAAQLYLAGYAPLVLPSGRYSIGASAFAGPCPPWDQAYPERYASEWEFLRGVLRSAGVPPRAILREDQATFTWDNARKSRQVTDREGLSIATALLCCKPYHARRALLYYQAAYPQARILVCPAPMPGFQREDWHRTPQGRERILGEVARLGSQIGEQLNTLLDH